MVKEHGGEISARNAEGGGAIIEVRLPSAGHAATAHRSEAAAPYKALLKGRILLLKMKRACSTLSAKCSLEPVHRLSLWPVLKR